MTHLKLNSLLVFGALTLCAASAGAESKGESGAASDTASEGSAPFAVSLGALQTAPKNTNVHGFRLNLGYGNNAEVYGFDLGLVNRTNQELRGFSLGLGNYVDGSTRGAQYGLVLSMTRGQMIGLQEGVYTFSNQLMGVQAGVVNHVGESAHGARLGAVNVSEGLSHGADFGIVNYARRARGLQLGIVNVTPELQGVQIGVVNVAKNGFLPFCPVINAAL
jgi:hypothetical protein